MKLNLIIFTKNKKRILYTNICTADVNRNIKKFLSYTYYLYYCRKLQIHVVVLLPVQIQVDIEFVGYFKDVAVKQFLARGR